MQQYLQNKGLQMAVIDGSVIKRLEKLTKNHAVILLTCLSLYNGEVALLVMQPKTYLS